MRDLCYDIALPQQNVSLADAVEVGLTDASTRAPHSVSRSFTIVRNG